MKTPLLIAALCGVSMTTLALAQTAPSAAAILSSVDATQRAARDVSFRLSGTAALDSGNQSLDLTVQSVPAAGVARLTFAAPDALADNIVVVSKTEVRNYLYLTNQVTVTPLAKSAERVGISGIDPTQLSNFSQLLKNYDVRVLGSSGTAGNRIFQLEGVPKATSLNDGRARAWIAEAGWRPTRLQLLSAAGKVQADLNVTNYKTNQGLTAARLTALPRDAEVVRQ